MKTPNFTVVSNAGEGTAQGTIVEFEQVRAAYGKVWPWAKLAQGRPVVVLALKNEDTLRRWAPGYYEIKGGIDVVSGSAGGADREYLLLRTDQRPQDVKVARRYFHLAQIAANQRFALFFPEKRPFFLEGVELFSTPIQALYTRTITAPRWGARATGKSGNVGSTVLVADDAGGGSAVIPGARSSTLANRDFASEIVVARVRRPRRGSPNTLTSRRSTMAIVRFNGSCTVRPWLEENQVAVDH